MNLENKRKCNSIYPMHCKDNVPVNYQKKKLSKIFKIIWDKYAYPSLLDVGAGIRVTSTANADLAVESFFSGIWGCIITFFQVTNYDLPNVCMYRLFKKKNLVFWYLHTHWLNMCHSCSIESKFEIYLHFVLSCSFQNGRNIFFCPEILISNLSVKNYVGI